MFRWVVGTTEEQVQALHQALRRLPEVIPELRGYRVGPDAGLTEGNWEFVVVAEFDGADAWRAYLAHPAHQQVIAEHVRSMVAERVSVQYHC
jgi:hypothetical protein